MRLRRIGSVGLILWSIAGPADARQTPDAGAAATLAQAVREARDADLQADWNGLVDARVQVERLGQHEALTSIVHYYLGYIDWRMSSLSYVVLGPGGQAALLERAVGELQRSVESQPASGEAQALLAICAAILISADQTRAEAMVPVIRSAWTVALEHGEQNPRVQLLRAMNEVFAPPGRGQDRERGFARWNSAIALFELEESTTRAALEPAWGHAEAWAWLGGAYLVLGQPAKAVDALERAVVLRPDFWWAGKAALPFARRPPM